MLVLRLASYSVKVTVRVLGLESVLGVGSCLGCLIQILELFLDLYGSFDIDLEVNDAARVFLRYLKKLVVVELASGRGRSSPKLFIM